MIASSRFCWALAPNLASIVKEVPSLHVLHAWASDGSTVVVFAALAMYWAPSLVVASIRSVSKACGVETMAREYSLRARAELLLWNWGGHMTFQVVMHSPTPALHPYLKL